MNQKTNNTPGIHQEFLPFTEEQVAKYFPNSKRQEQIKYFKNSLKNYEEWENTPNMPRKQYASKRQVEKDERFWTTRYFINLFETKQMPKEESQRKIAKRIESLLKKAFNTTMSPFESQQSWSELLKGDLRLVLECSFPAPLDYKNWLKNNVTTSHMIPYVHDWAKKDGKWRGDLEGATQVDAYIVNMDTGFNMVCEAKLTSDISNDTTYNMARNQIARNIDVMLEHNKYYENHGDELKKENRNTDLSVFLLVTPTFFKKNPLSRLYGYKMYDYKHHPQELGKDLKHRKGMSEKKWEGISKRIGWATWEDFEIK